MRDRKFRLYLEIRDPFSLAVSLVRKVVGVHREDSAVFSVEQDAETQTCRIEFRQSVWPAEGVGEKGVAVRFRDLWKAPEFYGATRWFRTKSPSTFKALVAQDMDVYLVIRGYEGTIPQPFLQEIARLSLDLAFLAE